MKNTLIIVGIIFVIAAGVVWFIGGQQLNERFPVGYEWQVDSLGQTSYPDEETGDFPEGTSLIDDPINLASRTVTASAADEAGQVILTDHYETRNATTNELDWEFTVETVVDSETGKLVEGDTAGDYYFFPRNAEKTVYSVSNSSYASLPVEFVQEEDIAGVNTYLYEFKGDLPNKVAYVEFVEFADNEDVICFDFELQYWVEPLTGEIIQYREWCEGDWVVDTESGERLYALQRWGAETSGDDLLVQTNRVKSQITRYRWMSLYLPAILGIAGLVVLAYSFVSKSEGNRTT